MPKMPGGGDDEKKEESAESREEAQEQVGAGSLCDLRFRMSKNSTFLIFRNDRYMFVSTGPNVGLLEGV